MCSIDRYSLAAQEIGSAAKRFCSSTPESRSSLKDESERARYDCATFSLHTPVQYISY